MKIASEIEAPIARDRPLTSPPVRACLHVLDNARTDIRAMRAAKTLVEIGYVVSLVDVEPENECTASEENTEGVDVRRIIVPGSFVTTRFKRWVLARALWMFLRTTFRLLRTPADIYHALDLPALPACYLVARIRRKPVIFESYEMPLNSLPVSELSSSRRLLRTVLAPLLAHMLPRCAGVITVSPPIVHEMKERYRCSNVALVRNIPLYKSVTKSDRLRQSLGLDPHARIALYQGYLQPDRGLERLIRAAKYLEENIVIVMMGKDNVGTKARLEGLIAEERATDRVRVMPPVPYNDLLNWTASADIGLIVNPPDYSLNNQVLLPNKLFEFIMAGLPVLSFPLESIVEVIKTHHVGRIIEAFSPQDIGLAINAMLADREGLEHMHRNALIAAQHELNWAREQQKLIDLYQGIVAASV